MSKQKRYRVARPGATRLTTKTMPSGEEANVLEQMDRQAAAPGFSQRKVYVDFTKFMDRLFSTVPEGTDPRQAPFDIAHVILDEDMEMMRNTIALAAFVTGVLGNTNHGDRELGLELREWSRMTGSLIGLADWLDNMRKVGPV